MEDTLPPVGSGCAGNISDPQIDHTAAAVMTPVNAAHVSRIPTNHVHLSIPRKVF
jgi:hypothetical protein